MLKNYLLGFLVIILFLTSISTSFAGIFDNYASGDDSKNTTDFDIVPAGDFSVSLRSNPSNGYSWNYTLTQGVANFVNKSFYQDETYMPAVGIGGYDCFDFKLEDLGFVELIFDYSRSWENSSICKKKFIIFVY